MRAQTKDPGLRALPHSAEAERAFLAVILLCPERMSLIRSMVPSPEPLYLGRHKEIYAAMLELFDAGEGIDLRTLQATLERRGVFEKVGGLAYLAALDIELPLTGLEDTHRYCRIIVERWTQRRLIEWGSVATQRALGGQKPQEALEQLSAALDSLTVALTATEKRPATLLEALQEYDPLEDRSAKRGLSTGFLDLDNISGGLRPGELTVLAASPGAGKSALALQVADALTRSGRTVRMHSLEDPIEDMMERILAQRSHVPHESIRRGSLTKKDADELDFVVDNSLVAAERFQIDVRTGISAEQIKAGAQLAKARGDLDLVIVDSLGLLRRPQGFESERHRLSQMTRVFHDLAMECGIPVLLIHHLSRAPINDGRAPRMTDLRDSGEIEQWAYAVWLLWRPEQWLEEGSDEWAEWHGKAKLLVAKNRGGETGTVTLAWIGAHVAFRDLHWKT